MSVRTPVVNISRAAFDVYCGRGGARTRVRETLGNPYPVGKFCTRCENVHPDRGSTLPCYVEYLVTRLDKDPPFREKVRALSGKTLGCHCVPKPCHAEILATAADVLKVLGDSRDLDEHAALSWNAKASAMLHQQVREALIVELEKHTQS